MSILQGWQHDVQVQDQVQQRLQARTPPTFVPCSLSVDDTKTGNCGQTWRQQRQRRDMRKARGFFHLAPFLIKIQLLKAFAKCY